MKNHKQSGQAFVTALIDSLNTTQTVLSCTAEALSQSAEIDDCNYFTFPSRKNLEGGNDLFAMMIIELFQCRLEQCHVIF